MNGTERAFLEALDGLAYLSDVEGVVLAVGQPRWDQVAREARAEGAGADAVIGRSVFDLMSGDPVRDAWRRIHQHVLHGVQGYIGFEYRCDAPDLARRMRMSVSRLETPGRPTRLLHQSQVLSEIARPWMSLFEPQRILDRARADAALPIVTMCGFCQTVAWPPEDPLWMEPDTYYRRGGPAEVRISHGVCPTCVSRL